MPSYMMFEPSYCDDLGETKVPFIIRGRYSDGRTFVIIEEPSEAKVMIGLCREGPEVRRSIEQVPRPLTPQEIIEKVHNHTTAIVKSDDVE